MNKIFSILIIVTLLAPLTLIRAAENEVRDIVFPVQGEVTFIDDFDQPRYGGTIHEATDLIGAKHLPLLAAVDGVVTFQPIPEPSWGYGIWIKDDEGYEYVYLHINNDTPGTDDGQADLQYVFAPEVRRGSRVTAGQVIAYLGDSGNAENVGPHLHFEIYAPDGTPINPYFSLLTAQQKSTETDFNPEVSRLRAATISDDKELVIASSANCVAGSLIKGATSTTVYYCGRDGKRYFFPNDKVFYSWYQNFKNVQTIPDAQLASVPLGGNVTYRPGYSLIKIESDPKVYAVDFGGVLRHVSSATKAEAVFGAEWEKLLNDVDVTFFINYTVGEPI